MIFIARNGQQFGPYQLEDLQRMVSAGTVLPHDLAWREGLMNWIPLETLPEFALIGGPAGLVPPVAAPASIYHHVAPWKFALFSLLSMGLYEVWWFYQNWKFIRRREAEAAGSIRPFWRAIFCIFYCNPLCRDIAREAGQEQANWPTVVSVLFFILTILYRLPDPWWLISLLAFVPLLVPVREIDRLNRQRGAVSHFYNRIGVWPAISCLVGGLILGLAVLTTLNVLPTTQVIAGDRLTRGQMSFLRENGVLEEGEIVHYFYSSGLASIREDGNIVTDRRVISYGPDEDGDGLAIESATFGEIKDVRVIRSKSFLEDTRITIVRDEDDEFELVASAEDRRDQLFIDKLKALHQAAKTRKQ